MRGFLSLLLIGALSIGSVLVDTGSAEARGGKGFLRGWGLRKVLPRNWGNRNNGSAGCNSCQQAPAPACNAPACNTQSKAPAAPAPLVDARPIIKPDVVPVGLEVTPKVFDKAEYCNATFENDSRPAIVVVFWIDNDGKMETGNYRPATVDTSRGMKYEITARNCVVHPDMKHYAALVAVRLPYDIFVRADGRQEIVMRS